MSSKSSPPQDLTGENYHFGTIDKIDLSEDENFERLFNEKLHEIDIFACAN
jgi:hypothetical protein